MLLLTSSTITSRGDDDVSTVPIVSVSSEVDEISKLELFSIFTLTTTRWQNGQKITLVLYKSDNSTQKTFLREYFGINTFRFQEIVDSKINSGKAEKPIIVNSEMEMTRMVANKPGRIGFAKKYVLMGDAYGIKQIKIN